MKEGDFGEQVEHDPSARHTARPQARRVARSPRLWLVSLVLILLSTLIGMTLLEGAKQHLYPNISPWESQAVTIVFITLIATLVSCLALRRFEALGESGRQEAALRRTLEEQINYQKQTEKQLRESEERFRIMCDAAPVMIWMSGTDKRCTYFNQPWLEFTGRTLEQECGDGWSEGVQPEDLPYCLNTYIQTFDARQPFILEYRLRRADGEYRWILDNGIPRYTPSGEFAGYIGSCIDITERKRMEGQLRIAARVFETSHEGILITDADTHIISVNRAFSEITGYSAEDARGQNPSFLRSGRHDPGFYRHLWATLNASGTWQGEIWNRRKNGDIYPQWLTITTLPDTAGRPLHYIGSFIDLSAHYEAEQRIRLALHDPLTGLASRTLLHERLTHTIAAARRTREQVAMLFLDLDRFKNINDSLGHAVGDKLLQAVASRLRACVREEDVLARLGGDEFVVVLGGLKEVQDATTAAKKILKELAVPYTIDGQELVVTASIGISAYPKDGVESETLIKHADAAMYLAKGLGRDRYAFYRPKLTARATERLIVEHGLRRALERDELMLYYQPQVVLESRRICGAEALIRWQHPEMGLVRPACFIPVAEESGLIEPIGEWVLRTVCAHRQAWRAVGLPAIRLGINLSAHQLRQRGFVEKVRATLLESGFEPGHGALELEVMETVLHTAAPNLQRLWELKELGVLLAIDDFGTGYSALNSLKHLPINRLKIDQSFVKHLPGDADDAAITSAIIAMGSALGLTVLAEGVERENQLEFLQARGCTEAQGYLFSEPVPEAEFRHLLTAWQGLSRLPETVG